MRSWAINNCGQQARRAIGPTYAGTGYPHVYAISADGGRAIPFREGLGASTVSWPKARRALRHWSTVASVAVVATAAVGCGNTDAW
ncbi:MAG: hypothetical protein QOE12_1459, partial [Mycobacterium sp.]|nr:hypothetical protein [Mycobacterium sp.]